MLLLVLGPAAGLRAAPAGLRRGIIARATPRTRAAVAAAAHDPPAEAHRHPEELLGPWEMRCSYQVFGSTWFELEEEGKCGCSRKVGTCEEWAVVDSQLTFTLHDKLGRPSFFSGVLRADDERGTVVEGEVRAAPKLGSSGASPERGAMKDRAVPRGEFSAFRLDG